MTQDIPKDVLQPQLWQERSVEDTQAVYRAWAESYEADVSSRGYHTPRRIAEALAPLLPPGPAPVLDFGCGTGLGGLALRAEGIDLLHGTDINPEMLEQAKPKGIYDRLWLSQPGELDVPHGSYRAIVAAGVISLGAAPPETLDMLIERLAAGQMLALSFNDPTLAHGGFDAQLHMHLEAERLVERFRAHGPHLEAAEMGSDVIVLQKL